MAKSLAEKNFENELKIELLNIASENNISILELLRGLNRACSINYENNLASQNISKEMILNIKTKRTNRNIRE